MNKRLIAGLLTAWCITVVAPAWVVYFALGGIDVNTPVPGPAIAIWVIGYLIQIGIFMVVARKSSGNSMLGWLLASTMPFVADCFVPVAPWSPAAVLVVVGAYALWFYSRLARSDHLQHNGIPARGTVLEVKTPIMNTITNGVYIRRTMTLRIKRADGTPPYEAKYTGTFMLGEIPGPGSVFNLRVDPKNPKHFETVDADAAHADTYVSKPRPQAPPLSARRDPSITEQLRQLDDMHQRGALTDDEFAAAKKRVLGG